MWALGSPEKQPAGYVCVRMPGLSIWGREWWGFYLKNWLYRIVEAGKPKCTGLADEDLGGRIVI